MKQHEQCVESWWAIRIGSHDKDSEPYFMRDIGEPKLFINRQTAKAYIDNNNWSAGTNPRAVRVVLTTLGETQ